MFNEGLNYNQGDIAKLPIVKSEIEDKVCKKVMETVEISKAEWDSFETSWDFQKHPLISYAVDKVSTCISCMGK